MLIAPMLQRLRAARDLEHGLAVALGDVVALLGAERGNIQLLDTRGQLVIVRHSGLPRAFLETFARMGMDDGFVCARAAMHQQTLLVPDVEEDAAFAPFLAIARAVPFRSVLSSPLVATADGCIGTVSVHFANRFSPSAIELDSLERYCGELAQFLCSGRPGAELRRIAEGLSAALAPARVA